MCAFKHASMQVLLGSFVSLGPMAQVVNPSQIPSAVSTWTVWTFSNSSGTASAPVSARAFVLCERLAGGGPGSDQLPGLPAEPQARDLAGWKCQPLPGVETP